MADPMVSTSAGELDSVRGAIYVRDGCSTSVSFGNIFGVKNRCPCIVMNSGCWNAWLWINREYLSIYNLFCGARSKAITSIVLLEELWSILSLESPLDAMV